MRVITGDINEFDLNGEDKGAFDRVMSIEMFEHMKNYKLLIAKISGWLAPGGKLFGGLGGGGGLNECAAANLGGERQQHRTCRMCIDKNRGDGERIARRQ